MTVVANRRWTQLDALQSENQRLAAELFAARAASVRVEAQLAEVQETCAALQRSRDELHRRLATVEQHAGRSARLASRTRRTIRRIIDRGTGG